LIAGLDWVAANANSLLVPIRVVNMSLSGVANCGSVNNGDGGDGNTFLQSAIDNVRNAGVVLYAAAGNADAFGNVESATLHFPANCNGVMAVASTTARDGTTPKKGCASGPILADSASRWSNFDAAISAPGQRQENLTRGCAFVTSIGIESLKRGGGTFEAFGTSMASPHVAGLAALLFESCGGTTNPDAVDDAITAGATNYGPHMWFMTDDDYDGTDEGIANVVGALDNLTCS
jgi:serine protease